MGGSVPVSHAPASSPLSAASNVTPASHTTPRNLPGSFHVRLSQADTQNALPMPKSRLSQAIALAASTPLDLDYPETQEPALATCWPAGSSTGLLQRLSPFSALSGPSYRGSLPPPAPAPVSGPAPPVQVVNSDIFARARMAAVQSLCCF